jgi:hypothetical protein
LGSLQDQFPGVKIAGIGINDSIAPSSGRIAQLEPRGWWGPNSIGLNDGYWGVNANKSLEGVDNGFHPAGLGNPEGYITHEFGHAVESNFEHGMGWDPDLHQKYLDWQGTFKDAAPISGYAKTDAHEKFAELFSAAMTPTSPAYTDPQAVSMRSMLKDTGVWKGPTA